MIINARKLNNFCKATSLLLQEQGLEPGEKLVVAQQIVMILQKRAIPETDLLDQTTALESRGHITQAVLELMCLDNALQVVKWAVDAVGRWLHDRDVQWKSNLDRGLERVVRQASAHLAIRPANAVKDIGVCMALSHPTLCPNSRLST